MGMQQLEALKHRRRLVVPSSRPHGDRKKRADKRACRGKVQDGA